MAAGEENPRHVTAKLLSQMVLIAAMLAAVAGGVFLLVRGSSSGGAFEVVLPTAVPASAELKVFVSGAVRNPGVYTANEGNRLAQLIAVAGGATDDADLAAINLALRVEDEDHWHIPKLGEASQTSAAQGGSPSGKIDLNSATVDELESLPGVGEVRAPAIIRYREANGPFARVEDLLDVQGIGPATLEAIRDLVDVR